jgi:hypothetical protein
MTRDEQGGSSNAGKVYVSNVGCIYEQTYQELRARKSGIRVQVVQVQEEELEEAAVNKIEGRDNTHEVVMKTSHGGRRAMKMMSDEDDQR